MDEDTDEYDEELPAARFNGWHLAMVFLEFAKNIFGSVAGLFNSLSVYVEQKGDRQEEERELHAAFAVELETMQVPEE